MDGYTKPKGHSGISATGTSTGFRKHGQGARRGTVRAMITIPSALVCRRLTRRVDG